jgi:hypothetical protein
MNVVSFSLFGSNPKYTVGALKNASLCKRWYPDYQVRFYVGRDVPGLYIGLLTRRGATIVMQEDRWPTDGRFWRFYAAEEEGIVLFRDVDSRVGYREVQAVKEWLTGDKPFHVMRDHPCHCCPVMAGMWGVRNKSGKGLMESMTKWLEWPSKTGITDQDFLADVWSAMASNACQHGSFFQTEFPETKPFPTKYSRIEGFVGEVFDEFDRPRKADRQQRGIT